MTDLDELLRIAFQRDRVNARRRASKGLAQALTQPNSPISPNTKVNIERFYLDELRQELEAAAMRAGLSFAELRAAREFAAKRAIARREQNQTARARAEAARRARRDAPAGTWQAWFDGSCKPNPGRMGIGVLLLSPAGIETRISRAVGDGDSAQAECMALIAALNLALELDATPLLVWGDSQVVLQAIQGSAPAASIEMLCQEVRALLARMPTVSLRWVPRHRNATADALAGQSIGLS